MSDRAAAPRMGMLENNTPDPFPGSLPRPKETKVDTEGIVRVFSQFREVKSSFAASVCFEMAHV